MVPRLLELAHKLHILLDGLHGREVAGLERRLWVDTCRTLTLRALMGDAAWRLQGLLSLPSCLRGVIGPALRPQGMQLAGLSRWGAAVTEDGWRVKSGAAP